VSGGLRKVLLMAAVGALAAVFAAQVAVAQVDETPEGLPPVSSREIVEGTDDSEVIRGTEETDVLFGGDGDDALYGFRSRDLLRGGRGEDYLGGGRHGDYLYGDRGPDVITGQGGKDRIFGGKGRDDLYAGFRPGQPVPPNSPARTDFVSGEDGDDFIDAADAPEVRDTVYCGEGFDRVVANPKDRVGDDCEVVRRTR
jgi:hypothetical protein